MNAVHLPESSKKSTLKIKRNRREIRLIAEFIQPSKAQLELISRALWSFVKTPEKMAQSRAERPADSAIIEFQEVNS
jgi:hypothetical protein